MDERRRPPGGPVATQVWEGGSTEGGRKEGVGDQEEPASVLRRNPTAWFSTQKGSRMLRGARSKGAGLPIVTLEVEFEAECTRRRGLHVLPLSEEILCTRST